VKTRAIYAAILLTSGVLRASESGTNAEQWQMEIAEQTAVLRPRLMQLHKDIPAAKMDELLHSLSETSFGEPQQSLKMFYQSRDVDIVSLSLKNPTCCVENIIMNKEPLPMEGVSQDSDRGFFEEIAIRAGRES